MDGAVIDSGDLGRMAGRGIQFVVALSLLGLVLISLANWLIATALAPWPFYAFALVLCGCMWMIGKFLADHERRN
jgi:hypothetical protein